MIIVIERLRPVPPPPKNRRTRELLEEMVEGIRYIARQRSPPITVG